VQSALENVRLLEKFDFNDIVVSVKSSSVTATIAAYRELAALVPYPLHLGVTEAGTARMGLIKSAIGIGSLLGDNIGDTIRVSLTTNDIVDEIRAAHDILRAVGRRKGAEVISCPTCGRCKIDVTKLAGEVEQLVCSVTKPLKIAVMGCAVNGPGECKGADYGITGGEGTGLIYKNGEIVKKVEESQLIKGLVETICTS
jgi:(E)-4-hydroxy-3-methylbut-2-enyl-diphosphate synthase